MNSTVFEVDVAHTFGTCAIGQVNYALAIVLQSCKCSTVREIHTVTSITEGEDFLDGFVRGLDFGLVSGRCFPRWWWCWMGEDQRENGQSTVFPGH